MVYFYKNKLYKKTLKSLFYKTLISGLKTGRGKVLLGVGGVPLVPRQLHHHHTQRIHLAYPLPSYLEVSVVQGEKGRRLLD